jgi:site-specific DNA-methyltransferase (adenine-specific)/modification methylase
VIEVDPDDQADGIQPAAAPAGDRWATLWQGDSRELLAAIPDASIDLICTDPPYNLGAYSTGNIEMPWRKAFNNDVAAWDQVPFDPGAWLGEVRRVLKPTGTLFAFTSYNLLGRWHETFDPAFDTFQFVVWHKTNPPPKLRRAGFLNSCELIVACWDRGHTWNFGRQRDMHNFIESPICSGRERVKEPVHPTQKPLRVLRRLIEWGSQPGGVVLDPFMGVGSTGVAAGELGRQFLGIEIDPAYFAAASRRIDALTPIVDGRPIPDTG